MVKKWWKDAVIYQIYPRSFQDTNGDGIGDLQGIINRLDYLKDLGVTAIWLCPFYESPNDDNGYDISNYRDIMKEFGSLADFDELMKEAHNRDLRVVVDLVVNHTSDEHPWFIESKKAKDNPYRDYYIWRKPKNGKEPNNWGSFFTPSAWEFDQETGEYYLHLFSKKQPDLNWENPNVRKEIYDIMNFWIDKGIDGFRVDTCNIYKKPEGLPDSPLAPNRADGYVFDPEFYADNDGMLEIIQEMMKNTTEGKDLMTVGEGVEASPERTLPYVLEENKAYSMFIHFEMTIENFNNQVSNIKRVIKRWVDGVWNKRGWLCQYVGSHDQPRSVSTYGNDGKYRVESAKMIATMVHTLPGTPFIYQGDEIGMTNCPFPSIEAYNDVNSKFMYDEMLKNGFSPEQAIIELNRLSRENSRTPIQWDDSQNAGFTTGKPWLMINPNYKEVNVKAALEDKNSIYYYYKELISLRKNNPIMAYGSYEEIETEDSDVYAYLRSYVGKSWIIILLFSDRPRKVTIPSAININGKKNILCNYGENFGRDFVQAGQNIELSPYEAIVMEL